jgi:hypothetical protein
MWRWIEAGFPGTAFLANDDLVAIGSLRACHD